MVTIPRARGTFACPPSKASTPLGVDQVSSPGERFFVCAARFCTSRCGLYHT